MVSYSSQKYFGFIKKKNDFTHLQLTQNYPLELSEFPLNYSENCFLLCDL